MDSIHQQAYLILLFQRREKNNFYNLKFIGFKPVKLIYMDSTDTKIQGNYKGKLPKY